MYDPFSPEPAQPVSPEEAAQAFGSYRPGFGQYLGAMAGEGFWATTSGQGLAWLKTHNADSTESPLTADDWQKSPWFRQGLSWDEGMTPGRAKALADVHDENEFRRWIIQRRQPDALEMVAGFGAAVVGSIPTAENFIPIAGPAFRLAQAAKLTRLGVPVAEAATARFGAIGGRAMVGSIDAAGGTALAAPAVIASRQYFGDDVQFADMILDIALGAAAGAVLGGAAGALGRGSDARPAAELLPHAQQQIAADALAKGMLDVADGQPVNLHELRSTDILRGSADTTTVARPVDQPAAPTPLPKTRAEEFGMDPATGEFAELADLQRMETAGRLTDVERAELQAANDGITKTAKLTEAYDAAAACALGA